MTTVDYENFVRGLPADQTAAERRASLNSINSSQSYHQKCKEIWIDILKFEKPKFNVIIKKHYQQFASTFLEKNNL